MYPRSVRAIQADALFVSALQRGDELNASQIWQAVAVALIAHGDAGCAGRVAQEFGDHPETATVRMRWARAAVAILKPAYAAIRKNLLAKAEAVKAAAVVAEPVTEPKPEEIHVATHKVMQPKKNKRMKLW